MATIAVPTTPAPSTPLNLKFDVVYAPRGESSGHAGYMVVAVCEGDSDAYSIIGYEADGNGAELFRGCLADAYVRMAAFLGMAR